jgi:protoheme IX farnesyltransferase
MTSPGALASAASRLKEHYWPLIKSRQTFLLTLTGVAGYLSARTARPDWLQLAGLAGSLLVTISGCTVLNMIFDRDIDAKMSRTKQRPLAAGRVSVEAATRLGAILIGVGLVWALILSLGYGLLVLGGAGLDVLVYTVWLKRRTAWSIIIGGLSGGMPILAGRFLGINRIEAGGLLLAGAIVCWIPSHNLTLGMLYEKDYRKAGIPTFLNVYGLTTTRAAVALSSVLTVFLMGAAFVRLGYSLGVLAMLGAGGLGLMILAYFGWLRPSQKAVSGLYKYSSFYMLAAMLLLAFGLAIR